MKTRSILFSTLSACAAILLASSCTTPPRAPASGFAGGSGPEVLGVQYAAVTGSDGDAVLLELDFGTETVRAFLRAMPAFAIDAPAFRADPSRLHGLDFCTALYGSIWNIYAAMTDAVFSSPFPVEFPLDSSYY